MLQKTELHLKNLVPCTVCYIWNINSRINVLGLLYFGSWYQLNVFRESVGPFDDYVEQKH